MGVLKKLLVGALKIIVAIVVLCAVFLGGVYVSITSQFDGSAELPADCALVFGAAVYSLNIPGPAITRRVAAASALYREGTVGRLILSGGLGTGNRRSEAEVMRALAIEQGVRPSDIILEDQSHSTWENIEFAQPLAADCGSTVAVSDQYHLARIELLSWRQGWGDLQTIPAQTRPPEGSEKKSMFREVLAYSYYLLYLDYFFPGLPRHVFGVLDAGTAAAS